MLTLQKLIQSFVIVTCVFFAGVAAVQAEEHAGTKAEQKPNSGANTYSQNWSQSGYGGMGGTHPMFNPAMWMNPMTWMNPGNYMSLMNPYLWMNPGNYMQMMNPMAYMNMMNPMMAMMGPMMNPMGMMGGMGSYGSNPMAQTPGGQMMDPKQYEDWYKQWTEMMKNMTPQPQANQ